MARPAHADPVRDEPAAPVRTTTSPHSADAGAVAAVLRTDPARGLSEAEATQRLRAHGPNVLPRSAGPGGLVRLLRQFHHPLVYVLLVGAAVMLFLRDWVDAGVILGVVLVNVAVGFVQESKAQSALESLRSLARTSARVVRDGRERTVPSEDLVPGDLVVLEAGDKVPADLRLLRQVDLQVDESALTGESVPAAKADGVLDPATPVADRHNMAWSGTLTTSGTASGVTVATGGTTQLGQISHLVDTATQLATPLTRKLAGFSRLLTVAILGLALFTFAVGTVRGQPADEMLTAAIALAVAAIPEGLPAAVTITLAIGVVRMARRRAVIRRLPAVETLGGTTVICSDKTGTLTENRMTVQELWTPTARAGVADLPAAADRPALRVVLETAAACNDAALGRGDDGTLSVVGDPTEAALLVAAARAGLEPAAIAQRLPRTASVPFSSEARYMATLHRDGTQALLLVKGAVERVLELSVAQRGADGVPEPLDRAAVLAAVEELSGRGLRVLATAQATWQGGELTPEQVTGLELTGLVALMDPPRQAAVDAVAACRSAGITVKMITGDHAGTARAIAGLVGLLDAVEAEDPGSLLTGVDLDRLDGPAYDAAVARARVFARVSPEQKLRLVEAQQRAGHVVAMTGDGVNDAPALRAADIGIAMGHGGTDVAKDAADMVLLDDDFATIEAAVEEGRGVFDNLTKFIVWTLPTNAAQGFVLVVAILLGMTLPVLPVQILWINMTTAVALGLMLAFEPKEAGIMTRPPREPDRPLLTGSLVWQVGFVSLVLVVGSLWMFRSELAAGAAAPEARTAALNLFVAVQIVYLFTCRSLTGSVRQVGLLSNRWLLLGVGVQLALQAALTWLPAMNALFSTAAPRPEAWPKLLGFVALAAVVLAVEKRVRLARR
jgi:cation-transporting P-type ATPase F